MNTNAEPRAATHGRKWLSRSNRLLLAGIVAAMAALSLVAQVALAGPPSPTGSRTRSSLATATRCS